MPALVLIVFSLSLADFMLFTYKPEAAVTVEAVDKDYIKWVEFDIPCNALEKAMKIDIETYETPRHVDWIDLLAVLGTKYGGDWKNYKASDMDKYAERLENGETLPEILAEYENPTYYAEAYRAVLSGFLGEYHKDLIDDRRGLILPQEKYGLKVFSPVAEGFSFNHYRDFGDSRSYGYHRGHLGNDLCCSIGTPIVAMEAGTIEEMGWNQYGGWRMGIRSFDKKRYYYYAHLRSKHPFATGLSQGDEVQAGTVIGYMGMTGYSTTEGSNNMKIPHLHFGIQLIFDESQKDGNNQIWIDVYDLVEFLEQNRATVARVEETKDYARRYPMYDEHFPRPAGNS